MVVNAPAFGCCGLVAQGSLFALFRGPVSWGDSGAAYFVASPLVGSHLEAFGSMYTVCRPVFCDVFFSMGSLSQERVGFPKNGYVALGSLEVEPGILECRAFHGTEHLEPGPSQVRQVGNPALSCSPPPCTPDKNLGLLSISRTAGHVSRGKMCCRPWCQNGVNPKLAHQETPTTKSP